MPALVAGIHVSLLGVASKRWMAGTSPAMTMWRGICETGPLSVLQPQIKLLDQIVVVELLGRAALERDLAVHDDVAAIGDAQCLREVLLRHQHGELVALLELLDLLDRARDQHRRKSDRRLVDQQDAR